LQLNCPAEVKLTCPAGQPMSRHRRRKSDPTPPGIILRPVGRAREHPAQLGTRPPRAGRRRQGPLAHRRQAPGDCPRLARRGLARPKRCPLAAERNPGCLADAEPDLGRPTTSTVQVSAASAPVALRDIDQTGLTSDLSPSRDNVSRPPKAAHSHNPTTRKLLAAKKRKRRKKTRIWFCAFCAFWRPTWRQEENHDQRTHGGDGWGVSDPHEGINVEEDTMVAKRPRSRMVEVGANLRRVVGIPGNREKSFTLGRPSRCDTVQKFGGNIFGEPRTECIRDLTSGKLPLQQPRGGMHARFERN